MSTLNVYWGHKHATDVNKRFGVYLKMHECAYDDVSNSFLYVVHG